MFNFLSNYWIYLNTQTARLDSLISMIGWSTCADEVLLVYIYEFGNEGSSVSIQTWWRKVYIGKLCAAFKWKLAIVRLCAIVYNSILETINTDLCTLNQHPIKGKSYIYNMDSKGGYPHPQPPPAYGFDNQPTHGAYIPPQTVYVEQPQGITILCDYIRIGILEQLLF